MLEQRRAQEKGYITLKEAAELSSYSADYLGQLIRAGKIRGEQVYSNVAWVTTEDEVEAYMQDKNRSVDSTVTTPFFASKLMSYFLYTVIALCAVFLLIMQYILYVSIDEGIKRSYLTDSGAVTVSESS